MDRKEMERKGEREAKEYLQRKGWKILHKNWQSKWGEIEIIAKVKEQNPKLQELVVFVEVKTDCNNYGSPREMVSDWKREQVKRMGEMWCQEYGWEGPVRVDAIGVLVDWDGTLQDLQHFENVV